MDINTLLLFAAACVALTVSPGPDMLLIASRTVSQGRKAGLVTLAGIQVGTYVHAIAAAAGLSQLMLVLPVVFDVIRWLGAAYLLYLAYVTWRSAHTTTAKPTTIATMSFASIFKQGLVTNVLNPKMALFVLALFPQFIVPQSGSVMLQMLILATIINVIGLVVNGAVILTVAKASGFLSTKRTMPWPSYLLSAVFAGLALRLAVSSRD
jgi:threonine/homoserine/homoserine lactone efflux protein